MSADLNENEKALLRRIRAQATELTANPQTRVLGLRQVEFRFHAVDQAEWIRVYRPQAVMPHLTASRQELDVLLERGLIVRVHENTEKGTLDFVLSRDMMAPDTDRS